MSLETCILWLCRRITVPVTNGSHSTQTTPTSSTARVSSSSGAFDTPTYASHRRKGSFGTPTHRHKASNGSRDFNAAELIAPSVPRAEMVLTAPVVQQRIHNEPLTDVLFSQYAVYSADACGQVSRLGTCMLEHSGSVPCCGSCITWLLHELADAMWNGPIQ